MNKLFLQNMELFLKVKKRNKLICIGAKLIISFPLANDTNTCLMQNKVLRLNTLIHVLMDLFFHLGIISNAILCGYQSISTFFILLISTYQHTHHTQMHQAALTCALIYPA